MQRCNEIQMNTRAEDWTYIPSEINIAYILSCDISFGKFHLFGVWFTGPEFLVSNNPNYDFEGLRDKTVFDEVCIETAEDQKGNVDISASVNISQSISPPPIFWEYYLSWTKFKRHVACLKKLKSNWLKWKRKTSDHKNFIYLSLKEVNENEIYLHQRA